MAISPQSQSVLDRLDEGDLEQSVSNWEAKFAARKRTDSALKNVLG